MSSAMYYPESAKKYEQKCKQYKVRFTLQELDIAERIDAELDRRGIAANAWLKEAIIEKLNRDCPE